MLEFRFISKEFLLKSFSRYSHCKYMKHEQYTMCLVGISNGCTRVNHSLILNLRLAPPLQIGVIDIEPRIAN